MNDLIYQLPILIVALFWVSVVVIFYNLFSRFIKAVEIIADKFNKLQSIL